MSDGKVHAFLPPSGAGVWVICAMWPHMNRAYPELEASAESIEGTAVHEIGGQAILDGGAYPSEGDRASNGLAITEEMLEGAELYAETVRKIVRPAVPLHLEQHMTGKTIHPELNAGTPDLWAFDEQQRTLDVFDFKFGHEYVDVYENWQLLNYVALIFEKLGIRGGNDDTIKVRMHVIQPRSYVPEGPVRTWEVQGDMLRAHFNILRSAAARATRPGPEATVNPGCKNCPGRHACTALQRAAQGAADKSMHALPVELPPAAVGLELRLLTRAAKLLDARITGLQEQAIAQIRAGTSVPGWQLESVQGREGWGKPVDEVIALGQALGVDVSKPGVITPNQARKKGLMPAVVEAYVAPRGSALKLTQADNTQARKVFG